MKNLELGLAKKAPTENGWGFGIGGGWLTVRRLAFRTDEHWCELPRVGAAGTHQTCRFKRSTSATKAGVNSAISVSMSRTWC